MNIYSKILLTILPISFLSFIAAVGTAYYFSHLAIIELSETLLTAKLNEALHAATMHNDMLLQYNLGDIPASLQKAKSDVAVSIGRIGVARSGYVYAIDQAGKIVAHPDPKRLGRDLRQTDLFQQIEKGDGLLRYQEGDESHVAVADQFAPWGWTFIVTDTEEDLLRVVNRMKPYLLYLGLFGSLLVAVILIFVIRRITEPLDLLTRGVERISQGDFSTTIPIKTTDEFGRLAAGFNRMSLDLYASHHELEKRVEERTGELVRVNEDLRRTVEEKRTAVAELKISEGRVRAILRASPIGIGLVVDRKMGWANDVMYSMVGYEKGSLQNLSAEILYQSAAEFKRVGEHLYKNMSQQEIGIIQTQWVKKDGTLIDCSIRACPLEPEDLSRGIIVAVADITAAKTMERKLQRAKKMEAIGTLAGGVAHDLNNILSGIVSYPELLLLDLADDSPLRKPLETIKRSGESAAIVVQDLLTMARRGVAVTEVINLNDIVRELLNGPECANLREAHPGLQIEQNLAPDLCNLKGSKTHLAKSIMNLLSNAAESMEGGGQIRISTANIELKSDYRGYEMITTGKYVVFTIEDEGEGIAETDVERIFEPFYTKKEMGRSGTGLGMAVVWGTVKDHFGYIDIQSRVNEGSIFKLFFPCTREKVSAQRHAVPLHLYRGKREKILIVDDSQLQREVAQGILEKLNYETATAAGGEEAILYLLHNEADVIVLDMIMPDGPDGLETYERIRLTKPEQKVIIASGFSETDRVKELQNLSGGLYLKKPYTIENLGKALRSQLE